MMFSTSDSRPWKILGFEGNIENEVELARNCKKEFVHRSGAIPVFGVIWTQINLPHTEWTGSHELCTYR
jgi:hypothetical protein